MGRTGRISPAATLLPKVVYEKVEDEVSTQPAGVHDLQARSYGYNDFSDFTRPEHYIRHIEPLESDLARQVEYDMDEQDQEWLDIINAERRKEQLDKVSYELFEIVMDRLEKEWFDLTKNIPKPDLALPSEDSTCAVCDDSEGENSNAIVFCDGCNLAVHQDCYGVPYIPEGQWLCRKCTVSPENPVSCILCPNEGGAFKQTTHGDWVHLLCAIWVPETRVVNEVFMEPVAGVEKITKPRWKLRCSICDIREGACIQCAKTSCFLAFHATCARKEKLLSSMKSTQGSEPATLTCYCERHLPKEQQEARAIALAAEERQSYDDVEGKANKAARAHAKTYQTGPPVVPALIVNRILQYITKVTVRKKAEFVQLLCRYWSLKREVRRGAPLLKRLHLEPWTAAAGVKMRSEREKLMKLEQLHRLREDLVVLRNLTELCRKRETRKYRQAEIIYDVIAKIFFPHQDPTRRIFERIVSLDKQEFFKNPVSKLVVPDYYDIVTKPMCWTTIEAKMDEHEYWDVQAFRDDVNLVIDNAILYNQQDSAIYRAAVRLKKNVVPLYEELDKEKVTTPQITSNNQYAKAEPTELNSIEPSSPSREMDVDHPDALNKVIDILPIGDLEPPMDVLELITSSATIKGDLPIDLHDDPLASLFNYELPKLKPPPAPAPPLPPPPPPKARKPKRDRKAELERANAKKAAAMATAAEALTLLYQGHNNQDAAPNLFVSQATQPEATIAQSHDTNDPQGFRIPRPKHVMIDTMPNGIANYHSETDQSPISPLSERHPHRRKRPSITLPGQSEIPPMVADVDNKVSFKMFDGGWILPPNHRRGGRQPVDRSTLPPPKKRMRTEPFQPVNTPVPGPITPVSETQEQIIATGPQRDVSVERPISSASTTRPVSRQLIRFSEEVKPQTMDVLDNIPDQSVNPASPQGTQVIPSQPPAHPIEEQMTSTVDPQPVPDMRPKPAPLDPSLPPPSKIVESANGTIIIEELDTPAIRRAKNLRRKEEKERRQSQQQQLHQDMMRRQSITNAFGLFPETPGESSSSMLPRGMDSELSSLSEFGSDTTEDSRNPKTKRRGRQKEEMQTQMLMPNMPLNRKEDLINVVLGEGDTLEGGTLVWAKADSYPWWPAVIFEDDDPDVPRNILQVCAEAREKRRSKLHILRFFDKNKSWQYLPIDRLKLLGEDPALDEEMQSANSKRQRWKSSTVRRECCVAYKTALAEMETGSDTNRVGIMKIMENS